MTSCKELLDLTVFAVTYMLDFAFFYGSGYLAADGADVLSGLGGDGLHVAGAELERKGIEDGVSDCGIVGVGDGYSFGTLAVENVEDVVVVG